MKSIPLRKLVAEAIGTLALVFFGCGAIRLGTLHPESFPAPAVPLVFGLVVATMIYSIGHISGAHLNPAVTWSFAIVKRFPWYQVVPYWMAQFCGGIAAVFLLAFFMPFEESFGATIPSVPFFSAFVCEMLLSFALMFVVMAVATDSRAEGTMAGVAVGGIIVLCAYVGGPLTGASMNPARTLAPALAEANYSGLWIYLTAPLLGTSLAAITYDWIRCDSPQQQRKSAQGCC